MESFDSKGVPTGWNINNSDLVEPDDDQGDVHSGNFSALLFNKAVLSQDISIEGGCFFELSFFARGNGAQVQLEACVTFSTDDSFTTDSSCILIRAQDIPTDNRNFAYYRFITAQAPANATNARIEFRVTANGEQSLNLDDVSFSVN
ncbi:hypothetical protein [Anaerotignum sp.]